MRRLTTNRKARLIMSTLEIGRTLTTYTPGKMTQYRFSRDNKDFFACKPIYTAVGIKAAESFIEGYRAALCYFNIESEI